MRMFIKPFQLTASTILVAILLQPLPVRADGGEEYYKEIRKLKSFDPATLDRIKRSTVDAERIKKVNELSRANFKHNADVEAKKKTGPVAKGDEAPATGPNGEKAGTPHRIAGKSKPAKKSTPSKVSSSAPVAIKRETPKKSASSESSSPAIKVNSDTPDELSFPGDEEKK